MSVANNIMTGTTYNIFTIVGVVILCVIVGSSGIIIPHFLRTILLYGTIDFKVSKQKES